MRDLWDLFVGFFLANIFGYGGGPASIPLMYEEIVNRHAWMDAAGFANMLALGNMLPGPIATKIAVFTGFDLSGWVGALVALAATVVPSATGLILLLRILQKHRKSVAVKGMTLFAQPVIAAMMLLITLRTGQTSVVYLGIWQSLILAALAWVALVRFRLHPAFVILGAFAYGSLVVPYI